MLTMSKVANVVGPQPLFDREGAWEKRVGLVERDTKISGIAMQDFQELPPGEVLDSA